MINIRQVTIDDAEDVCRICCDDLGYRCDKTLVRERISQLDPEREAVFVAVSDDKVIVLTLSVFDSPRLFLSHFKMIAFTGNPESAAPEATSRSRNVGTLQ